jgi:mRNA-degrading endonuclease RelE of RelBE toxin-antitoxin system
MTYVLVATTRFDKDIRHLMPKDQKTAFSVIAEVSDDPYLFKLLGGSLQGLRSARFGAFRIIYRIDEPTKRIFLITVKARERVYE